MNKKSPASGVILIIEDNPRDLRLLQKAFQKASLSNPIEVARDGKMAIDYFLGNGNYGDRERYPLPCLIILDLKLPKYGGHEVLERIKGEPILRRIPVIVLTSSMEHKDVSEAYDLGANSYLLKPVRFDDFIEMAKDIKNYWLQLNQPARLE